MMDRDELIRDLVIANRILAHEGVLDAFGHVSVRDPDDPKRYLMARSRAPELVEATDIMTYDLEGAPAEPDERAMHAERFIHGCIYEAREDVMAVCHNHAHSLIPDGVTGTPMRPIWHMAAPMGEVAPVWDIRDDFGDTDMLVTNNDHGRSLAKELGDGRVCLMRGHGVTVAAHDVKAVVFISIYLMINAEMLAEARKSGPVTHLSPGEVEKTTERMFRPLGQNRAWEYWCRRAGFETTTND